jgi:hypothetical protein
MSQIPCSTPCLRDFHSAKPIHNSNLRSIDVDTEGGTSRLARVLREMPHDGCTIFWHVVVDGLHSIEKADSCGR